MAALIIVKTPSPILRQIAKPVTKIDRKIVRLISDMIDTLNAQTDPQGVGLAACQVGEPLRIFLMKPTPKSMVTVVINPKIISQNSQLTTPASPIGGQNSQLKKHKLLEGCLSIPNYYSDVKRPDKVRVTYTILNTKYIREYLSSSADIPTTTITQTFVGLPAQIMQHEIDHLNGKLFVDLVLSQKQKLLKLSGDKWEEVKI
jgi:peptide deformylase